MAGKPLQIARAVREAALATEGVFGLGKGQFVEAATYDGSEKVSGVVVDDDSVEVYLVLDYPLIKPIPELDREMKNSLASVSDGRALSLIFEDLAGEDEKASRRSDGGRSGGQTNGTDQR